MKLLIPVLTCAALLSATPTHADTHYVSKTGVSDTSLTVAGSYFPNSVGSYWVYLSQIFRGDVSDTVRVGIVDTVKHEGSGKSARVWSFTPAGMFLGMIPAKAWVTHTSGRSSPQDTLAFYSGPRDSIPDFLLVTPLTVGGYWECGKCDVIRTPTTGRSWVKGLSTITTPAGEFEDVYHMVSLYVDRREPGYVNLEGDVDLGQEATLEYWIKPGIGIVRMVQTHRQFGTVQYKKPIPIVFRWELLEYHIEPNHTR